MVKKNEENRSGIQVLNKAAAILIELSRFQQEAELSELARRTGVTKSTCSRILTTLKAWKIVRQNPVTKRYGLGHALIHLGNLASSQLSLPELFHFRLEKLMELTGETASLVILDEDRAVYIDQVPSKSMIRSFPSVGSAVYLHCTAVGKVLLSGLSPEKLEQVLSEPLTKFTPKTITDPEKLKKQIEEIKLKGYSVDDEETELGGRCIAAPIFNSSDQVIAAVGISGPSMRITKERIPNLAKIVMGIAKEISAELAFPSFKFAKKKEECK